MPPLRSRGDLEVLVNHFLRRSARLAGRPIPALSRNVLERFRSHAWPGNVRMLRNVCEIAVTFCDGPEIELSHLPQYFFGASEEGDARVQLETAPAELPTLAASERDLFRKALERTGGNRSQAAKLLGVSRATVSRKIKKYSHG